MFSDNRHSRTHESPMDFEWAGRSHGPTDPNSPFPQLKPGQKGGFNLAPTLNPPQTSSSFASPSSKTAPQFRNPSFTTPRKPFDADLFSEASGVESSPGETADAEDTPDQHRSDRTMTAFTAGATEKQPIFGRYGTGFMGNSPGRADLRRGKYAQAVIANKARKRKRMEREIMASRGIGEGSDSEDEAEGERVKSRSKVQKGPHWFSSLLSQIESRPNLPNLLSYWLQLSLNFFVLLMITYGLITFWLTIRADVDKASEVERQKVIAEIAECGRNFVSNRCGPDVRVPAMESQCILWQRCMDTDPASVGRARVSATTFAHIFNSFVEPISWKAISVIVIIIAVCITVNNVAFGMFRSKHPPQQPAMNPFYQAPPQQSYQWGAPPQTPRHNIGYDEFSGQTYQQIMPSQTPGQRSPSKEMRSPSKGNRSPTKGDRY